MGRFAFIVCEIRNSESSQAARLLELNANHYSVGSRVCASSRKCGGQLMSHRVAFATLTMILGFYACTGSSEPPFTLGRGGQGALARKTSLRDLSANRATYHVEYPLIGLESEADIEMPFKNMIEERFAGKWKVMYHYSDVRSKALQLPDGISVYASELEKEPFLRWTLLEIVPNEGGRYKDENGRTRLIGFEYFEVMSGGP